MASRLAGGRRVETAMVNEALCKVVGHNVCCLIQSMHELGITPMFWQDEEAETAAETAADLEPEEAAEAWAWV